jgi:hypothetical protein
LALHGIDREAAVETVGNRIVLLADAFQQSGFDLTGKELHMPFGSTLHVTQVDPAHRRDVPLIIEDETVHDMLVVGTLHILPGATLTVTGTVEILPV